MYQLKNSNLPKDILATVSTIPTENGGREGIFTTGFRPQFFYNDHHWDASIHFEGDYVYQPGDTFDAYFAFISPDAHLDKLSVGKEFELYEGARVIAKCVVKQIIDLPFSAKLAQEADKT